MVQQPQTDDIDKPISAFRLRVGITIWILSWLPFPTLFYNVLHANGKLQTPKQTSLFYTIAWTVQIIIGLCGVALAGKEAVSLIKEKGIKRAPKTILHVIWTGKKD